MFGLEPKYIILLSCGISFGFAFALMTAAAIIQTIEFFWRKIKELFFMP